MLRLFGLQSKPPGRLEPAVAIILLRLLLKVLTACEIPIMITVPFSILDKHFEQ